MRRYNSYNKDPYWLKAKFGSKCTCGKNISRGDDIFYYPIGHKAICKDCGHKGQSDLNKELSMEQFGNDCMFDR